MFEIVKREHARKPDIEFGDQRGRDRVLDRVCSASKDSDRKVGSMVFLIKRQAAFRASARKRRTSIMRAIKCLKSIRWMPWR